MTQTAQHITDWYRERFEQFEKGLNGESTGPIHLARRAALAAFSSLGFPTTSDEEWRFTNVGAIAKLPFETSLAYDPDGVTAADVQRCTLGGADWVRMVFINGHYAPAFSSIPRLPAGVRCESLAAALREDPEMVGRHIGRHARYEGNAFTALSAAFLRDGAFIHLDDGAALETPVQIIFLSSARATPFVTNPRNLFVVGENSRVSLVETYAGVAQNVYWTNAVTEIVAAQEAVIEHDKLQMESGRAFHIGTASTLLSARSTFTSNSIVMGGALVRNDVSAVFDGEHAECTLNGLSLGTGKQHIDNHTTIDHAQPNCSSHELYKAILDGSSRGVFNGKIFVRRDAQKTDAKQTNKTLLLSDDATIDTKPQLEIFADDVKCTHGATVGQLDDEQVFYLLSRGIGLDEARDLLTFAFASDVISRIHVGELRAQLDSILHSRLQQGRVAGEG